MPARRGRCGVARRAGVRKPPRKEPAGRLARRCRFMGISRVWLGQHVTWGVGYGDDIAISGRIIGAWHGDRGSGAAPGGPIAGCAAVWVCN
jgi:hypothetical protein